MQRVDGSVMEAPGFFFPSFHLLCFFKILLLVVKLVKLLNKKNKISQINFLREIS
jgi:hypothetical protein